MHRANLDRPSVQRLGVRACPHRQVPCEGRVRYLLAVYSHVAVYPQEFRVASFTRSGA